MANLSSEAIDRLAAGRALDIQVAENVMGVRPDPLEPFTPPKYSTDATLADQLLAHLQTFVRVGHRIDEHATRGGHRVDYSDMTTNTILLEATASTRAAAIARFALHFVRHHPEAKGRG